MPATGAGAIPFLALSPPIAEMLPVLPAGLLANAAMLQIGYGVTIASFLGGIHWAMAMAEYGGAPFTSCAPNQHPMRTSGEFSELPACPAAPARIQVAVSTSTSDT